MKAFLAFDRHNLDRADNEQDEFPTMERAQELLKPDRDKQQASAPRAPVPAAGGAGGTPPPPGSDTGGTREPPPEHDPTSTKNAVMEAEREQRGREQVMKEATVANPDTMAEARRILAESPIRGELVVTRLLSKQTQVRNISVVDEAILLAYKNDLMNQRDRQMAVMRDPNAMPDAKEEAGLRWDDLEEKISNVDEATHASGAEWGRLGQFRQRMLKADYSFEALERKFRKTKGDIPLTKEESERIKKISEDHEKARAEIDRLNKELENLRAEKAGKESIATELGEQKKRKAGGGKGQLDLGAIVDRMKAQVSEGAKLEDMGNFFKLLQRHFIEKGVTELNALNDAIHGVVKEIWPDMTETDTLHAWTGYGKFRPLDMSDPVEVRMRETRTEGQKLATLQRYLQKLAGLKTGFGRQPPTEVARALDKEGREVARRLGIQITNPEMQLKSSLDAIKTRLKNEIADMDYAMAKQERMVKDKTSVEYDAEAKKLKADRDAKKAQYDEMFPKEPESIEKHAQDVLQRVIDRYAKTQSDTMAWAEKKAEEPILKLIREHIQEPMADFEQRLQSLGATEEQARIIGKETATERTARERIAAERQNITPEEQLRRATKIAEKSLTEWQARLERAKQGDFTTKRKTESLWSPELGEIKSNIEALKEEVQTLKDLANPGKSDVEKSLQASYAAKLRRIAELDRRKAAQDYGPRPKKPPVVATTPEEKALEAKRDAATVLQKQAEVDFKRDQEVWRRSQMGRAQRVMEGIAKWRRTFVLTGLHSLFKLTSAAAEIMGIAPAEQAIGAGIGKLLPGIAKRAPSKGGFSPGTEGHAVVETFKHLFRDAKDIWKTGNSSLDLLYGNPDIFPPEFKDYIGRIHAALKSPAKRNQWVRSFEYRLKQASDRAAEQGLSFDPKDPAVQLKIGIDAYRDSMSSIFYDDNIVVTMYKRALSSLEQAKDPATGKQTFAASAAKLALKVTLPIVRIPTNIVARTFEYSFGTLFGTARISRLALRGILGEKAATGEWHLADGVRRGIEELHPDEADSIIRNLARGSLGTAVLLLGYYNPQAIGGYYFQNVKRDEKDVQAGNVRVFGHEIPRYLIHNPLLEQLQIGASIRRLADTKLRKSDTEPKGVPASVVAAYLGLTEQVPFLGELSTYESLKHPGGGTKAAAYLTAEAIPQLVRERAKEGIPGILEPDKDAEGRLIRRAPKTYAEYMKMNVPVLRQEVPLKKPAARGAAIRRY